MLRIHEAKTKKDTNGFETRANPQSKELHSFDSFVFMYRNLGGVNDNIKIEINYSLRSHIFEPKQIKIVIDVIENEFTAYSLEPIENFAAKINALSSTIIILFSKIE